MNKKLPMRILGWVFTLLSGIALGVILFIGRESIMTLTMLLSRNTYLPRAVDKFYLVVAGIIWLVVWMLLEGYYSRAVEKGRLWAGVLRVTGAELVLFFLMTILAMFFTTTGVNWLGAGFSTLALFAGLALLWLAGRMGAPKLAPTG